MNKPIEHFRTTGMAMLLKWAKEKELEKGSSNVLGDVGGIRDTNGGQGGWPPGGAGSLSPLSEQTDLMLRELWKLDSRTADYLVAAAVGHSITHMADNMDVRNRSQANIELKEALAFWTAAVYYRGAEARGLLEQLAKTGT